jgi:hypothetical protein
MVVDHLGSDKHKKYKGYIATILRRYGYFVNGDIDNEKIFKCKNRNGYMVNYYSDLFAWGKNRRILIEVHGYKGHESSRAVKLDRNRWRDIDKAYNTDTARKQTDTKTGDFWYEPIIEYFELWFWQAKGDMEKEILEELKIV